MKNIMFISISMNEEKKLPKIWHPQQEKILKSWGEAAACYRYMHYQAYCSYKNQSMKFTIPLIIVSTITGTANFAQETFPPTEVQLKTKVKYIPFNIYEKNLSAK